MKKLIIILASIILLGADKVNGQVVSFTITTTPPTCTSCCNGSFSVAVSGCTSYTVWTSGLGAPTTFTSSVAVYSNVCPGSYTVMVMGANPCTTGTQICIIGGPTGIKTNPAQSDVLIIFPNPLTETLLTTIEGNKIIEIADVNGKIILDIKTESKDVSLKELSKGIYFVSVYDDKKTLIVRQKIIKTQ